MNRFGIVIVTTIVALSLFAAGTAFAYHVKVTPSASDDNIYHLKIGDSITFTVNGYMNEESDSEPGARIAVERAFWQFDYAYFQKISSGRDFVTLKALKEGRPVVSVNGCIGSYMFKKSITVEIKK